MAQVDKREYMRQWNASNLEYKRKWYAAHREERLEYRKQYSRRLKQEVIAAYGGKCAHCGETNMDVLETDHINGGGTQHRRDIGRKGGTSFYFWLRDNDYPGIVQLLCRPCHKAKHKKRSELYV